MNRPEWIEVVQLMRADWPHAEIPDVSIAKWYADLADLPAAHVRAAVETLYRDGREFPPSGATIRLRALELAEAHEPDWTQGYSLATDLAPGISWHYGDLRGGEPKIGFDPREALAWLAEQDPIAADVVKRFGVKRWAERQLKDEQIQRAQFRQMYEAIAGHERRRRAYRGIEPAGLPVLERANGLRRLGVAVEAIAGELGEAA